MPHFISFPLQSSFFLPFGTMPATVEWLAHTKQTWCDDEKETRKKKKNDLRSFYQTLLSRRDDRSQTKWKNKNRAHLNFPVVSVASQRTQKTTLPKTKKQTRKKNWSSTKNRMEKCVADGRLSHACSAENVRSLFRCGCCFLSLLSFVSCRSSAVSFFLDFAAGACDRAVIRLPAIRLLTFTFQMHRWNRKLSLHLPRSLCAAVAGENLREHCRTFLHRWQFYCIRTSIEQFNERKWLLSFCYKSFSWYAWTISTAYLGIVPTPCIHTTALLPHHIFFTTLFARGAAQLPSSQTIKVYLFVLISRFARTAAAHKIENRKQNSKKAVLFCGLVGLLSHPQTPTFIRMSLEISQQPFSCILHLS